MKGRGTPLLAVLLSHSSFSNDAIVATPTSSLPRRVVVRATGRIAMSGSAMLPSLSMPCLASASPGILGWILETIEREGYPRVLYDLDGNQPPPEREDPELEGYRHSQPVRWGDTTADHGTMHTGRFWIAPMGGTKRCTGSAVMDETVHAD